MISRRDNAKDVDHQLNPFESPSSAIHEPHMSVARKVILASCLVVSALGNLLAVAVGFVLIRAFVINALGFGSRPWRQTDIMLLSAVGLIGAIAIFVLCTLLLRVVWKVWKLSENR